MLSNTRDMAVETRTDVARLKEDVGDIKTFILPPHIAKQKHAPSQDFDQEIEHEFALIRAGLDHPKSTGEPLPCEN